MARGDGKHPASRGRAQGFMTRLMVKDLGLPWRCRACPQRRAHGALARKPFNLHRESGQENKGFPPASSSLSGQDSAGLRAAIYLLPSL